MGWRIDTVAAKCQPQQSSYGILRVDSPQDRSMLPERSLETMFKEKLDTGREGETMST